jgi:hypothetical protein
MVRHNALICSFFVFIYLLSVGSWTKEALEAIEYAQTLDVIQDGWYLGKSKPL